MLSELRCIEGRLLPLPSIFQSLVRNVHMLEAYNNDLQVDCSITSENHDSTQQILQNYVTMARAYSDNVTFLLDKIRGTAQLLSDTLNLKHQHTTQNISENTLALTTASVQDSATIRVITVVTLLYLPTTFIAVSFLSHYDCRLENLTFTDGIRNAIFRHGSHGLPDSGFISIMGFLCACHSIHRGHLWLLEVDGQETTTEGPPPVRIESYQ